MRRHRSISQTVSVDVDVDDVIRELSDEDIRAIAEERGIATGAPSFDLIEEIRIELLSGRANAALALIDCHQTAALIPDAQRQAQYQCAGRAH